MTRRSRWAACALFCLSLSAAAQTRHVVTFEDIAPNDLADGYGELAGWSALGGPGISDADLGGNGLKSFYGHGGMLTFLGGPVRFEGVYYKSYAAPQDDPPSPALDLWYHGAPVASIADPYAPLAMAWLASSYHGPVDAIQIHGGLEGFSIDDLTYERMPVSSVPDPATWTLMVGGLGLLGLRRLQGKGAARDGD
ncbi:hypothetical protein LXT12_10855 [Pelomonas sp. P7]|uniref:PEP-CTERM protein-sorting domain-containing protein n=1 Tax=Pelomonas caseinilytica TaxID=2906763 RepID=A0ABS8XGQ8_9BURK|nr:PEP-CTERM sorting domain-containing protein [Pelomonas sp. P7]MCE4537748.1 hypothetical protein [Pelomonas sp. P7]